MRCENNRGRFLREDSEAAFVTRFKVASEAITEQNNKEKIMRASPISTFKKSLLHWHVHCN